MDQKTKLTRDLTIGYGAGYNWDQLKYWVNSIKRSGFQGDIVLCGTDLTKETVDKLTSEGVTVSAHGNVTDNGDYENNSKSLAPHIERFFWLWNFLNDPPTEVTYRYVITTDVRDVIFQKNPIPFMEDNLILSKKLLVSNEGLLYEHEPWGADNFQRGYGPFFYEAIAREQEIANVGVVAGEAAYVKDLLLSIFQMCLHRPYQVLDQAAYNFLLVMKPWRDICSFQRNASGWAIQLGTTEQAVFEGAGDLGKNPEGYKENYIETQPIVGEDVVKTCLGQEFCIVHQYDRINSLKTAVERIYGA